MVCCHVPLTNVGCAAGGKRLQNIDLCNCQAFPKDGRERRALHPKGSYRPELPPHRVLIPLRLLTPLLCLVGR
jgi:hypothetical protein